MKLPSPVQSHFAEVPEAQIERSVFDRTHGYKTTFDEGYLIPFLVDEVLPGDTFSVDATIFGRFASALIVPLMDNLYLDTFYFYVPYRIIWDNFVKFMGEQRNPGDSVSYTVPTMTLGSAYTYGTLGDYFGLPVTVAIGNGKVSSLPFRAYNLVWNQHFRDENLQNSVVVDLDDGPDDKADYLNVLKRGKRPDYFTSSLPFPQKGTAVPLPLGTTAPVIGVAFASSFGFATTKGTYEQTDGLAVAGADNWEASAGDGDNMKVQESPTVSGYPGIRVDLSSASAATINELRQAWQLQRLMERDARGGTRYPEIVRAHYNVSMPTMQWRSEFLGGNSTPIVINPVVQTSSTDGVSPQANVAAFGHFASGREGFSKSFVEHGVLLGLMMIRADMTYQNGLHRMWTRSTKYDFYWPALAHLGEQAVLNREIYFVNGATDTQVFGYQERYAEYRYKPSMVTGKFRSDFATPLDVYHLAQNYTSLPTLGATFIVEQPPVSRVVAVTSEPHFIVDCYIKMRCVRPMPVYSVPGLVDHF